MSRRRDLSWKPRLRGEVYCSPACGRGCTKAEHDAAVKAADLLARSLGLGWKPRVWENLGWHYAAYYRGTKVMENRPDERRRRSYTVYIGDRGSGGGRWFADGATARGALRRAIVKARREIAALAIMLADAEKGAEACRRAKGAKAWRR